MVSLTTPTVSVLLGEGAGGGALAVLAAWFGERTAGPSLPRWAGKYRPLLPVLREFVLRPDTPLHDDVKHMITRQLDKADIRLAAICGTPHAGRAPGGRQQ